MALGHREPDRVPVCLAYETPRMLAGRYGRPYDAELMRQDVYAVRLELGPPDSRITAGYLRGVPAGAEIDAWGVARWLAPGGDTVAVAGPLLNVSDASELDEFPFPAVPAEGAPPELSEEIARLHRAGCAVQGAMSQTIFELAWHMCGMEKLLVGFYENPDFVNRLLDEITVRRQGMARCFARAGVDILRLGDDVGTQRGMMFSPRLWRRFLKGRLASVIAAARAERPGIPVFYHSDGDVRDIIEELIEIGVTILNPVQPECMDPFELKRRYGGRLALWGTVGTQSTLPRGAPAEVRRVVREYLRRLAPGGGYVIGPTHSINRDVPWENIMAFYETVRDYGAYAT